MRKVLIIALGIASLAALVSVQSASAAQNCKEVCDQWAPGNSGKPRCFSARVVCTNSSGKPGSSSGTKTIQEQKVRRQN